MIFGASDTGAERSQAAWWPGGTSSPRYIKGSGDIQCRRAPVSDFRRFEAHLLWAVTRSTTVIIPREDFARKNFRTDTRFYPIQS